MSVLIKFKGTTFLKSVFSYKKALQLDPKLSESEYNKLVGKTAKKKDPVKESPKKEDK